MLLRSASAAVGPSTRNRENRSNNPPQNRSYRCWTPTMFLTAFALPEAMSTASRAFAATTRSRRCGRLGTVHPEDLHLPSNREKSSSTADRSRRARRRRFVFHPVLVLVVVPVVLQQLRTGTARTRVRKSWTATPTKILDGIGRVCARQHSALWSRRTNVFCPDYWLMTVGSWKKCKNATALLRSSPSQRPSRPKRRRNEASHLRWLRRCPRRCPHRTSFGKSAARTSRRRAGDCLP